MDMTHIDLDRFFTYRMDLPPKVACLACDVRDFYLVSDDVYEARELIREYYPEELSRPDWLASVAGGNPAHIEAVNEIAREELVAELEGE